MTDTQQKTPETHIDTERKIIHLMLKHRDVIEELLEQGIGSTLFDESHKPLVEAIYQEYMSGTHRRLLTRQSFRQILSENNYGSNSVLIMSTFDICSVKAYAKPDEISYLSKQLIEWFISRQSLNSIKEFTNEVKTKGYFRSSRDLIDKLESALSLTETRRSSFVSISELKDEYLKRMREMRDNPGLKIRCGIPEIDESMPLGFAPMHLTLFVAPPGGHKTNTMLNIALNIYEAGHSVLFIPLEMDRFYLMHRIVSNRADIHFGAIANPEILTDEQVKKVEDAVIWLEDNHKFCILDADDRTSVSSLKASIQKHLFSFQPKVVIVDYIANLKPDVRFSQRNDLEIGEILKTLRFLGKQYQFSIISAAQMSRAAIKSLREGKDDVLDSTSAHGSQQYGADADNMFALLEYKDEPDKLGLVTIKSRYGPKGGKKELRADPAKCRVYSTNDTQSIVNYNSEDLDNALNERIENIPSADPSKVSFSGWSDLDTPDLDSDKIDSFDNQDELDSLGI